MAAQGPTTTAATPAVMTTSRLTQMQMRFQQRQQQERDQRKVEMVSATKTTSVTATSGGSSSSSTIRSSATAAIATTTTSSSSAIQQDLSASLGAGKVRQMFDERRHHKAAGIDKSYPLQPIGQVVSSSGKNGNTVTNGSKAAAATANGLNNKTRVPPISANTKARLARQQQENGNEVLNKSGGGSTFDDNENLLEDEKFPDTISFDETDFGLSTSATPLTQKLPNVGKLTSNSATTTTTPNGPQNVNSLKLKPVPGRVPPTASLKSTPAAPATKKTPSPPAAPAPSMNTSPRGSQPSSAKSRASTGKSGMAATTGTRKSSAVSLASTSAASMDNGPVPDGMARCTVCGRNFAEDRIAKHRDICQKTKSKKRRVFDATKHRVQGTDAEKYVMRKGKAVATSTSSSKKSISGPSSTGAAAGAGKGDWRRKHEEFIAAIRAAKEMKAYLAKGGKLSDLPPPPPSENPDYIQCPHCSRRFNQTAAERHIPKCATMLHNKPKPGAAKGRRF